MCDLGIKCYKVLLISTTLPYTLSACVRNTHEIVTFVIGKMKPVSFSLFLDAFPHRPKTPFTYVVNVYSDMSLSKRHLGSDLQTSVTF